MIKFVQQLLLPRTTILEAFDPKTLSDAFTTRDGLIYCGDDTCGVFGKTPTAQRKAIEGVLCDVYDGEYKAGGVCTNYLSCSVVITLRPEVFLERKGLQGPLLDRALLVKHKRLNKPESLLNVSYHSLEPLRELSGRLLDMKREKGDLQNQLLLNEDAKKLFVAWRAKHYQQTEAPSFQENLEASWNMHAGHVLRISGVLHWLKLGLGQLKGNIINMSTVQEAIAVVEFCKKTRIEYYGEYDSSVFEKQLRSLVRIAQRKGALGVELRDIRMNIIKDKRKAEAFMKELEGEYGEFKEVDGRSRKLSRFFLYPSTFATFQQNR